MTDDEKKELRLLANRLFHAHSQDQRIADWSNVIKVAQKLEKMGEIK